MLSYRHSYHAGNFADVLKHIILVEIMVHLTKKPKPFDYIDTHAGAGIYDLKSYEAKKVGEFEQGIAQLDPAEFPELENYFKLIRTINNDSNKLNYYPGSPYLALKMMRPGDHARLHELHPKDFKLLDQMIQQDRDFRHKAQLHQSDGYQGLMAALPPQSRRGLVLIDPSYEIKSEYNKVVETIKLAHKKFPTGVLAIWYPVVERNRIKQIDHILYKSGLRDIHKYELAVREDATAQGMTASGMWVINPPWDLMQKMQLVLPKLKKALAQDKTAFHRCEVIVPE